MLPISDAPRPARAPDPKAPAGAIDSHIHILAAGQEFPLWENRVEDPAKGMDMDAFIAAFRQQMQQLGIARTVVVHSILFGSDNSVTIEAIARLGQDTARGIGLLVDGAPEAELDALHVAGIRGIRMNYVHGGVLSWEGAKALAPALAERGMHLQMLINTHKHLVDLKEEIENFPAPIVFDHLGWPDIALGPEEDGFQTLCNLMRDGHVYTKLSGLYRLSSQPFTDTDPFVAAALAANPDCCLWGSDFPYIMLADAHMPDAADLLNAFHRVVTDPAQQRKILVETPEELYGFAPWISG